MIEYMRKYKDISGLKFNRALALYPNGKDKHGNVTWCCKCDCGKIFTVKGNHLRSGNTKSCGCYQNSLIKNVNYSHGHSSGHGSKYGKTKTYNAWRSMKSRCYNKNVDSYPIYGGKGIKVCSRWKNSFENFLEDMGEPPDSKSSLDRIDGSKDYSPENCRWATATQQVINRRILKNNKSGISGVRWKSQVGKWHATIGYNHKKIHLGYFHEFSDALKARKEAEIRYHEKG